MRQREGLRVALHLDGLQELPISEHGQVLDALGLKEFALTKLE